MDRWTGALPKILTLLFMIGLLVEQQRRGYFHEVPVYIKAKAQAGRHRVLILTCAVIFSLGLIAADPLLLQGLQSFQSPWAVRIAEYGGFLGRNIHPWVFAALLCLLGRLARSHGLCRAATGSIFAAGLASILSFILKFSFLRARPYSGMGPWAFFQWEGLFRDARAFQSFTSGDVAVVAAMAFYFFFRIQKHPLAPGLWLLPLGTAFSRVYVGKHWPSDTLVASALGYLSAEIVFHYDEYRAVHAS